MLNNNIQLRTIGKIEDLPEECKETLKQTIEKTKDHTGLVLNLALSYSGRWDILNAVKQIAIDVQSGVIDADEINEEELTSRLTTSFLPDPDLLIRTSGEFRLSNFLLWEVAYSEIFISDVLWPDFNKEELAKAVLNFQRRERRFGLTGDQVK
jgi:undecaprenyl diphosphate synthase